MAEAMTRAAERQYRPGEHIPGTEYVVIRLEAEGGHGALYLVHHHFLEKKVQMLKTLRSIEPSPDLIERFKREAQMLAGMDHPHIVSVTSGGLTDEKNPRPYFVMERLKGKSLAQILPNAPEGVGIDAALKVTIEVCDALEYVHTKHSVVHRDIKPDNVFLQVTPRNGSVTKLLDFGVAHMMDLEKRYTNDKLFLGTPRYASPEQIMGDKPTPRTDLYAVGLLVYELLLGKGPFDDATNFATIATAHSQRPPPPFPTTRRFPEGLESLVMSLLAKDPKDRPKSAEWLATRLRQIRRIAELAELNAAEDLNKTELSPVQNVLTGHRGELTEAGVPPDVLSQPTLRDTGDKTSNESPLAYNPTARAAGLELEKPVIDRQAPTRSAQFPPPAAKRTDTEELADAHRWTPQVEAQPASAAPTAVPAPQAVVTATGAVELTRDGAAANGAPRYRAAAALGVVGAFSLAAIAFAIVHAMSARGGAEPASAAATASSAPPPATSASAPSPPAPSPEPPPAATTPPEPPPSAASPVPTPSAEPPSPPAASAPAPVKRAPPPRPAPPKLHLPPSGL
jgi:eukaryotic-like serine/threonine-protein kinase